MPPSLDAISASTLGADDPSSRSRSPDWSETRIRCGLPDDNAESWADVRAQPAHRERAGGDADPDLAGARAPTDDRERVDLDPSRLGLMRHRVASARWLQPISSKRLNVVRESRRNTLHRSAASPLAERIDPPKASLYGCRSWSSQDDAQVRQAAGVIPDEPVSIQPIEVVVAEIVVRHPVPENVPRGDHDGVGDGHDRFLVAAPASQPVILDRQVTPSSPDGPPGALDQRGPQPAVALAGPARLALAVT